jgi:hypothetical protein
MALDVGKVWFWDDIKKLSRYMDKQKIW